MTGEGDRKPDPARRARVIRNAIILALAAAAVYGAFFLVMAERSSRGLT